MINFPSNKQSYGFHQRGSGMMDVALNIYILIQPPTYPSISSPEPSSSDSREDLQLCTCLVLPCGSLEDEVEPVAQPESCFCLWAWGSPRNCLSGELPPAASTARPALRGRVSVCLVEKYVHDITLTHILELKNVVFQTNKYKVINRKSALFVLENQVEIIFQAKMK